MSRSMISLQSRAQCEADIRIAFAYAAGHNFQSPLRIRNIEFIDAAAAVVQRYQAARKILKDEGRPDEPEYVFHGTAGANINSIFESGFRRNVSCTGDVFGLGIYCSTDPWVAAPYMGTSGRLVVSLAVLGQTTATPMHDVPKAVGKNEHDAFECQGMVCTRTTDQMVPMACIDLAVDSAQLAIVMDDSSSEMADWLVRLPEVGQSAARSTATSAESSTGNEAESSRSKRQRTK